MGILCDLFVSTPDQALKYGAMIEEEEPLDAFVRVEFKGMTNLEFETLQALIEGVAYDPNQHKLQSVTMAESTWLFRFPPAYVERLASLSKENIRIVATAWDATDELQWPPEETEEVLIELVRLARLSTSTSRGLYHWGSL